MVLTLGVLISAAGLILLLNIAVGIFALGLGLASWNVQIGTSLIVLGGITFAGASVIAIAGEVETYRALKR